MQKIILLLSAFIISFTISSQEKNKEIEIKNVIDTFFEGLQKGDSSIVSKTLHVNIKIQTTNTSKEGEKLLKDETREQLLKAIASKKPTQKFFEKLLSYDIKIDGNLASVWTPYEFFYNDTFSHCGANSFQLFNNNGNWEIVFLIDIYDDSLKKSLTNFLSFSSSEVIKQTIKIFIFSISIYMNRISSLEGNDIFAISRIFQEMYENELDDYVEVNPPQVANISSRNEKGSTSFKDFIILWNKIVAHARAYGFKNGPQFTPLNDAQIRGIKAMIDDVFKGSTSKEDKYVGLKSALPHRNSPGLGDAINEAVKAIQSEINATADSIAAQRVMYEETVRILDRFLAEKDGIENDNILITQEVRTRFINTNSGLTDTTINGASKPVQLYEELRHLKVALDDALSRLQSNFVMWNSLIISQAIDYTKRKPEMDAEMKVIDTGLASSVLKDPLYDEVMKQKDELKKFIIKFGDETSSGLPEGTMPMQSEGLVTGTPQNTNRFDPRYQQVQYDEQQQAIDREMHRRGTAADQIRRGLIKILRNGASREELAQLDGADGDAASAGDGTETPPPEEKVTKTPASSSKQKGPKVTAKPGTTKTTRGKRDKD